jgi:DNA adenine methylase
MRPLLRRRGSKLGATARLIALFPPHFARYVEPFAGAAAVYFARDKPNQHEEKEEVLADLDPDLMRAYELAQQAPEGPCDPQVCSITTRAEAEAALREEEGSGSIERQLARALLKNFLASPGVRGKGVVPNPYGKLKHLGRYKERLANTKLHCSSYEQVLDEYDSPDAFFFLDPPYDTRSRYRGQDRMDYEQMAERLARLSGRFLMTLNCSPAMREIFAERFHLNEIEMPNRVAGLSGGPPTRVELLVSNYPPPNYSA